MAPRATNKRDKDFLFSKGDIAEMMDMTTQAFANRSTRDKDFPQASYSNKSGSVQLYTADDVKKIYDHLTKADRARIAKLDAALGGLNKEPAKESDQLPGQTAVDA
jgi:hypothetical protein